MLNMTDHYGKDVGFTDEDVQNEAKIVEILRSLPKAKDGHPRGMTMKSIAKKFGINEAYSPKVRRLYIVCRFSDSVTTLVGNQRFNPIFSNGVKVRALPAELVEKRRAEKECKEKGKATIETVLGSQDDIEKKDGHWYVDGRHEFNVFYSETSDEFSLHFYGEHVRVEKFSSTSISVIVDAARAAAVLEDNLTEMKK